MTALNEAATTAQDKLQGDKKLFLEKVKAEKLKTLHNFPLEDDSDKKVSSSANFYMYVTEQNTLYLNYYHGDDVVYETTSYHLSGVDWMEYIQTKVEASEDNSVADAMLAGPASRIVSELTEKDAQGNKSSVVLTLQDRESHKVRMLSVLCDQSDLAKLKAIPVTPLIEDKSVIEESPAV